MIHCTAWSTTVRPSESCCFAARVAWARREVGSAENRLMTPLYLKNQVSFGLSELAGIRMRLTTSFVAFVLSSE